MFSLAANASLHRTKLRTGQEPVALPKHNYPAIDLGILPVDLINNALGTELEPGRARLSRTAHRHMAEDHPADYPVCRAEIEATIATPDLHRTGSRPQPQFRDDPAHRAG